MKKRRLFGENISPECSYCQHALFNGAEYVCCVKKKIKNGKCGKFSYNPTLRIPPEKRELALLPVDDFKL